MCELKARSLESHVECCWGGGVGGGKRAFGTYGVKILCITSMLYHLVCVQESQEFRKIPQASLFISSSEFCEMSFRSASYRISSCRPTAAKLDLRRAQNSSDPKAKAHYIKYFKVLRKVVKEAKKQHYSTLMVKSNKKIKATWKVIKKQTGIVPQGNMFLPYF